MGVKIVFKFLFVLFIVMVMMLRCVLCINFMGVIFMFSLVVIKRFFKILIGSILIVFIVRCMMIFVRLFKCYVIWVIMLLNVGSVIGILRVVSVRI